MAARDAGGSVNQSIGGALALALLRQIAVSGKSERHFAGGNEVVEEAVALAHRNAIRGHDVAEEPQPALLRRDP